jgi:hypothetical protein
MLILVGSSIFKENAALVERAGAHEASDSGAENRPD